MKNVSNFQILLSCMYQTSKEIIQKSNLMCDSVIINQCNKERVVVHKENSFSYLWIDSKEKGLSKSRNMAIRNSTADICLIADDDETFYHDCAKSVLEAFKKYSYCDVIVFNIENLNKPNKDKIFEIGYLKALNVSSVQIAFRRKCIIDNNIWFDESMGSGTGNGSGEENKFLFDCLKCGLKIRHVPVTIGILNKSESLWFNGFTNKYFQNRGWATSRYMGKIPALLYAVIFCILKYKIFRNNCTFIDALLYYIKGIRK